MSAELPKILILKAITPSPESAREEALAYHNLASMTEEERPREYPRMRRFWEAETDGLEEELAARELAHQYLMMGSLALQHAAFPSQKDKLSDRFTEASSELYDLPDPEIAKQLYANQQAQTPEIIDVMSEAAEAMHRYIDSKYKAVFEALEAGETPDTLSPTMVADRFEAALKVLAESYDEDWSAWTVERNEEKDSLSIVPPEKKILVGMRRAELPAKQLKSLFAHEVLIHAQRSLNGDKRHTELSTGLPNYLDIEEGLGVFVEYALTGEVPEKNIDRYIDIAFALGMIDSKKHTRQEMLEIVLERLKKRNDASETKKSEEAIEKEAFAHVNRIYRGSLGNEHIGVFTKDIVYYKGFLDAGQYIETQLEAGKSIDEIMDFLLQGKFDPTNDAHVKFVENANENL